MIFKLTLDQYPGETGWILTDLSNGQPVESVVAGEYSYEDANNQWKNVVIASGGNILTSAKVEKLLERIFVYFIAGKAKCQKLPNGSEWLDTLLEDFKEQVENEELTQLPEPNFK